MKGTGVEMFGKKKNVARQHLKELGQSNHTKQSEIKWCPTQRGTYTAYYPEWKNNKDWERIPTVRVKDGIPEPAWCGGINSIIWLFGYAQAQALAWKWAAMMDSEGKEIEVRVQAYEVVYDIKARKIDQP